MSKIQPAPLLDQIAILEAFRVLYDDLDLQIVESRLIDFISSTFNFDRTAFFYVKHRKGVLQGKLGRGFAPGTIEGFQTDLSGEEALVAPLHTGAPLRVDAPTGEAWEKALGLSNYALVPILNRRRSACWQHRECLTEDCPAFLRKWMHCWLIPDFECCEKTSRRGRGDSFTCFECSVLTEKDMASMEGVLLGDNSLTGREIDPESVATLTIIADVVGRAINNSKLLSRAIHDAVYDYLTGLYNRRFFDSRVSEELSRAKRHNEPLCLLFADVDDFKLINDVQGHVYGDKVLRRIGDILKENLRKCDVAARYGGDEFAILLAGIPAGEGLKVAEKIRGMVSDASFDHRGKPVEVTMSIGVACTGEEQESDEMLLQRADRALYAAKAGGRNRSLIADPWSE